MSDKFTVDGLPLVIVEPVSSIDLMGQIRIDDTGVYFRDEKIEDAGRLYRLLCSILEGKEPHDA